MNAAVMASGHAHGGADGARAALETFWKRVSDAAQFSPMQRGPMDMLTGQWTLENSPMYMAAEMMSRLFSPYDLNPRGTNPLRGDPGRDGRLRVPGRVADQACSSPPPTCAPARGRVFRNAEITPDVLLASGCLPTMFQAVEIDGEPYWDGGYVGQPDDHAAGARMPSRSDTILVQINPIERPSMPKTARDILNRLNEVSFNSPLLKELRMIALLRKVADPGRGEGAQWAGMRIHRIATDRVTELDSTSKMITEWRFLCGLRDEGRRTAQLFLDAHARRPGQALDARPRRHAGGALTMGLLGILLGLGAAGLAGLSRLERARPGAAWPR